MELNVYQSGGFIIVETGITEPGAFKLFDMPGKMVMNIEVIDKERIPVSHIEAGLYYYKLVSDSRLQTGKIRLNS